MNPDLPRTDLSLDRPIRRAMRRTFHENYICYGARKTWAETNQEGKFGHVARCAVEGLMAVEETQGVRRRKKNPYTQR